VAANLAGESRLDIGEAHIIRPAAGVHLERATADAMHKDFRGAAFAHLAEGVLIFTWHAPNSAKKILLRIRPSPELAIPGVTGGGKARGMSSGIVVRRAFVTACG
jgi:hypothetical protein